MISSSTFEIIWGSNFVQKCGSVNVTNKNVVLPFYNLYTRARASRGPHNSCTVIPDYRTLSRNVLLHQFPSDNLIRIFLIYKILDLPQKCYKKTLQSTKFKCS